MMRAFFLTIATAFSLLAAGQGAEVAWGEDIKISRDERFISLIGTDDSSFYSTRNLTSASETFSLDEFDRTSLQRRSSTQVEIPSIGDDRTQFEDIFFINNKFYLFTSLYDGKTDSKKAYCTLMNNRGQWLDLPTQIDQLPLKKWKAAEFRFEFSQDSSLFMVYHLLPFNRNSNESFSFKVYDRSLSLLWEKRLELPYGEEAFEITDYALDSNGNVFMLTGSTQEKVKDEFRWKQLRQKKYVLLAYDWQKNKLTEFDVSLKDKWIIAVTFDLNDAGDISIGGFYSNDQYFTIAGTFFFTLQAQSYDLKAKGLMAFDKKFLEEFMNQRRVEKGRELPNFYFDHLVLHEDGSAVMVAEQFNVTERVTNDPTTGRPVLTNFYNYSDVMVVKVNSDGSIRWARRLPKRQSMLADLRYYASYSMIEKGDAVYLLYNDNPENWLEELLDDDDLRTFSNIKKSVAALVKVEADGNVVRERLFSHKDAETILRPQLFFQENDEVIIYGQYKKNYRFGRIDLSPRG